MSKCNWDRFSKLYRYYPNIGLAIDVSRMSFPGDYLKQQASLANKAIAEMKSLEDGAIANPDEGRMVGHYWLRTTSVSPNDTIRKQIETEIDKVKDFSKKIHAGEILSNRSKKFSDVLLIGIGGSALGPQLLKQVFASLPPKLRLNFFDNTDPDGMQTTLLDLGERINSTLVLVVSKSGGTVETRNGQIVAANYFKEKGLDFSKQAVAITVSGSALDSKAKEEDWLAQFYLWDWVGGRTSIFSTVGLLPAALLGLDIDQFLSGASSMDELTRDSSPEDNPALLLALMWYYAGGAKGDRAMVVLPYKDCLSLFSKYLQQLVMESLGKEKDLEGNTVNQGINVFGNKGSTDQHAYIQQLRDGRSDFFATFIEVQQRCSKDNPMLDAIEIAPSLSSGDYLHGFLQGTRLALSQNDRDSITITLDRLAEASLGALIALYERAVGFYATMIGINAYHQPGVEAGKNAAEEIVELQVKIEEYLAKQSVAISVEEIAKQISQADRAEEIFKILCSLHFKPSSKVRCTTELVPSKAEFGVN